MLSDNLILSSEYINTYYLRYKLIYNSTIKQYQVNVLYIDIFKVSTIANKTMYKFIEYSKTFTSPLVNGYDLDLKYFKNNFTAAAAEEREENLYNSIENGLAALCDKFVFLDRDNINQYNNINYMLSSSTVKNHILNDIINQINFNSLDCFYVFDIIDMIHFNDIKQHIIKQYKKRVSEKYSGNSLIMYIHN